MSYHLVFLCHGISNHANIIRKEYHANTPNTFNLTHSPWPSGSPAVHRNLCRESQTSNFHRGCIRSCHRLDVVISRKAGRKVLA